MNVLKNTESLLSQSMSTFELADPVHVGQALKTVSKRINEMPEVDFSDNKIIHACYNCKYRGTETTIDGAWGTEYIYHNYCKLDRTKMDFKFRDIGNIGCWEIGCNRWENGIKDDSNSIRIEANYEQTQT